MFTDNSKTEVISDIEEAEVSDFDPDRVVNLDDSVTTNFAVVAEGVIKVTEGEDDSAEAENSLARKGQFNIVQSADDENLVYVVANPSNRLKYAREGQIVSVEYGEGDLFVTRIVRMELNGVTLTIYGSRDFELGDAFDFLKLEEATGNGKEYQYVQGSSPAGVTWLGETTPQQYETNSIHVETSVTMQQKLEIGKDNPVTGTIAFGVAANFHFYYSTGTTDVLFETKGLVDGEVEYKISEIEPPGIPLGEYTLAYKPGISMKVNPELKFTAEAKIKFKFSAETSAGFQWINGAVQTVDENPVAKFEAELEGKVSLTIDLKSEVNVLRNVAKVKLKAPLRVSVKFTRTGYSSEDQKIDETDWGNSPQHIHGCKICYNTTSEFGLTLEVSVILLKKSLWSKDITIPLSVGIPGHWSVDYNDFDLFGGDCQHTKYRVVITMDKADSANTVIYYRKADGGAFEELGKLNAKGWLQVYLDPGTYTFSNVKDLAASDRYYGTLAITDSAQRIKLRYGTRTGECGADGSDLTWELTESGMLSIKGTGKMRDFTDETPAPWPAEEITGLEIQNGVTSIGKNAFKGCDRMLSANISNTVREIGDYAFSDCTALKLLDISVGTEKIGKYAFNNCTNLESIKLPGGRTLAGGTLTRIEEGTFAGCETLTELQLPDCVTEIGSGAFSGCKALSSMELPDGVKYIPDEAFSGCSGLKKVSFADDLSGLGEKAFYNCTSLQVIAIPDGVQKISKQAFFNCRSLISITLPKSVTSIDDGAFASCRSMSKIELPEALESIGEYAFANCEALRGEETFTPSGSTTTLIDNCMVLPKTLQMIGDHAFEGCSKLDGIVFEKGMVSIGNEVFRNCTSLSAAVLPDSLMYLGEGAFFGCTKIESVVVPNQVARIENGAFYGCTNLKNVIIPDSVIEIGNRAFSGCSSLTSVSIPNGVEEIGESVFYNCANLNSVDLPASVLRIGAGAFMGCTALQNIVLPDGLTSIGGNAFHKSGLTSIEIPDTVKELGAGAFAECEQLKNVAIGEGVTSIGNGAFSGCLNLENIIIPDAVTIIEAYAFDGCKNLKEITIPNGVTSIEAGTFVLCENLKEIIIPNGVTSIGEVALYGCSGLKEIVIPDSVTSIGKEAFQYCSGLKEIAIPDGVTSIGVGAFQDCYRLEKITIPDSVKSIGSYAFYDCSGLKEIAVPNSVRKIDECTFQGCSNLQKVGIPEGIESIEANAFYRCDNLLDVYYAGTKKQWQAIEHIDEPSALSYATIHCTDGDISPVLEDTMALDDVIVLDETFLSPEEVTETADESEPSDELYAEELPEAQEGAVEDEATPSEPDEQEESFEEVVKPDAEPCDEMAELVDEATNAIITGTTARSDGTFHALFSGLTAGEEYAVILSRSAQQPLKAGDLVYINQLPADADGTLDVPFKADGAENLSYVVACRRGEELCTIEVTHGRSSDAAAASGKLVTITADDRAKEGYEFSKWAVLNGDVTLANASAEETTFVMGSQNVELEAIYSRDGSSIRVIGGTADKSTAEKDEKVTVTAEDRSSEGKTFQKWEVLAGGVTLANARDASTTFVKGTKEVTVQAIYTASGANKPGTSGGVGGASGGGGAAGAAIGGAAVVVGLVTMLPVKVSGVVIRAEAVLPNATVQLVKDGAVVAQTVTDANGSFTLKAKRGTYQLNITWQDAAGQPVMQSVAVTAPAADLTVQF